MGVTALSPVCTGYLGVKGPEGKVNALEFACLIGLFQTVGGKPAAFDPLGKILLGGFPIHPEGNYTVGGNAGLLAAFQKLGGAAHGTDRGSAVLVHSDLCAAGTAGDNGGVREGHSLAFPLDISLKIMLLHPLNGSLRYVGSPAGGALQTLLGDVPFDGSAAVGTYLAVHFFLMFCLHTVTLFRNWIPDRAGVGEAYS